jgi:hypothetical protein
MPLAGRNDRVGEKDQRQHDACDLREGGKETGTEHITVWPDGKTMRIMEKGTLSDGKPFTAEYVFEKQ